MPRQARIDYPGLLHHIMVRGIERRRIFRKVADYTDCLRRIAHIFPETGTHCFAWALMPNHIHLLLQTGMARLGLVMQRFLTGYASSFNLRYQRVGHLFQNRYKDIICEDEPYFLQLVRYIHLNPMRAGMVSCEQELAAYPWTGHSAILGRLDRPWQAVDSVLERFGQVQRDARLRYQSFIMDGWAQGRQEHLEGGGRIRSSGGYADPDSRQAFDQRILGSGDFVEEVLRQTDQEELERSQLHSLKVDQLIKTAAQLTGAQAAQLLERGRTPAVSMAKAMVIYAGVTWLGKSVKEMGDLTCFSSGGASEAKVRGRALAEEFDLLNVLKSEVVSNVP